MPLTQVLLRATRALTRHTGRMKTALTDIKRLLANLIRAGVVSRVDTAVGRCRVAISQMETAWLPWLTPRAGRVRIWSAPSRGEQVTVLSPGAICPAALYCWPSFPTSTLRPPPRRMRYT
ncbi:hypothetical protein SODG_002689 [Sodalis praecaptivus]